MLVALREFSRTWVAKILFGVLLLSMLGFLLSSVIIDLGTSTVARVGEEEITVREYQRAYQTQVNQLAGQIGSVPTTEQALAMGIPGMVLSQLAADAAINQFAQSMGIGVSDARLARMLRQDPSFAGTLGTFDASNFQRVLQQSGYTEADYFALQARAARRQQLAAGLFADGAVPEAGLELANRYAGDTRTINYAVLNITNLPAIPEPTEEELAAYLTEHQAEFRTQETRTADVLVLSPEALAATKTITDEQIAAEYERTQAGLTQPERRTIQQVVLPDEAASAAFEAGRAAGRSLAELAQESGLAVTELGTLARTEITDTALADAAYGVGQGEFAIIPGAAGQRAVGVAAIDPGGTPPLEEVRDDIAQNLARAEARNEVLDILDQVEELRASFQPLADIAARFNLPVAEVTLTSDGAALEAIPELGEEERGRVAAAIFAAEQGKLSATVSLSANENVWFDLKSVEPARDQTLEEVRDAVVAAWTAEKTDEIAMAEAERLVAQIKAGTSFEEVAAGLGQLASVSPPIGRGGDGTPILDSVVAGEAFSGGPGHVGFAKNSDQDYVVFQVVDVVPAEAENTEAAAFIEEGARDSMFADFVSGLRQQYGVRENAAVIEQLFAVEGQ